MATLAQLKAQIATDLVRNDLTTDIASAVSDAIAEYQTSRFAFNQAQATFDTVAGTEYYDSATIPTDIAQIDNVRLTGNGLTAPLQSANFAWMEAISTNTSIRGRPGWFAWYAEKIRLYPIPDAVYTVTISYHQKIAAPANDAASNEWTTEANELIRLSAMRRLMRGKLRDYEGARTILEDEQRAYLRLKREARMLETGQLMGSM